eukprot:CAMPEP_0176499958 /NCGR_PEP_ID=MMETSP0200_2-20121128/13240_1 /TAXON_ID=947934 /ORGANISM="Chaetoceros sp., Strain GSL56" /LENGTH=669 /DNA_ID=CAMNT_0017898483 /DNA_START=31 /DNA_END=2037 /DNA_ORIENTATION=-
MQRRPKTSATSSFAASSSLPRFNQHTPVVNPPAVRRYHYTHPSGIHRSNKNSSIFKNALQLFIAVSFGLTCMVIYKNINNGGGASSNSSIGFTAGNGSDHQSLRKYQSASVSKDHVFPTRQYDLSSEGELQRNKGTGEYHVHLQQQKQQMEKSQKEDSNDQHQAAIEEDMQKIIKENNIQPQYNPEEYKKNDNNQIVKRTTEEANAYMNSQPSNSSRGEQLLKQKLMNLYELQQKSDLEDTSPIVTRYLGTEDTPHWLPKSSTSDEIMKQWKEKVEKAKDEMRRLDREMFPELYGLSRIEKIQSDILNISNNHQDGNRGNSRLNEQTSVVIYPSPAKDGSHPIVEPTFGQHRSHVDAVFALAEGYDLKIYVLFIESLKDTGFSGDLVLSVSALDQLKPGVEAYLRSYVKEEGEEGLNVVAYTVSWTCYERDGVTEAKGANEGVRKCQLNGMYGDENNDPVDDPFEPRPVATARYELYWAWSLRYDDHSWLMLIDSRDAYFQLNPFAYLERDVNGSGDKSDGVLYFFEENAEASTIGQSTFNSKWLKEAYGQSAVEPFFDKPIICSGSTMGEKVAIESYLRGMVAQFEKTKCKAKGCDQGFHNYLYYSGGLQNVKGIREVKVFEQGTGTINNLGVLRSKPLSERGLLDENMNVLNWDKSISPVAHQWDRD